MGGKSKSSQTQTSQLTGSSQKTYDQLSGQISSLLGGAYKPYTGDLSADRNPMQDQAAQAIGGLMSFTPQQVSAQSFTDADLAAYTNPELENVLARSMAGIERNRQLQQVSDNQSATMAGAFGGSRHGVADSLTNEAYGRLAADTEANLRSDAFNNAYNRWAADRAAQLQADQFNSGQAMQGAQFQLGAAGLLGDLGAQDRQFEQMGLDRQYAEAMRQYEDQFKRAQGYLGLLGATPWQTTTTGTSVSKGGTPWAGILGTAAQVGGSLFGGGK